MLVLARFSNAGAGSGSTIPHGTQTKFECGGDQPKFRRLRRLGVPATRARTRDPQERHHENCRTTAGRRDCLGESSLSEFRGNQRDQAVWRSAQGPECRGLMVLGEKAETTQTIRIVPTALGYVICTTFPREREYR